MPGSPSGSWSVITAATEPPVTTTEAKLHLRVDHSTEDTYIAALVAAAVSHVENMLGITLTTTTLESHFGCFPTGREIRLFRGPLQSVTSVEYVDQNGDEQTLDAANYFVDIHQTPGRIVLDGSASWPATDDRPNAVTITHVVGYGDDAADVPQDITRAIYLIIGEWYRSRENSVIGNIINQIPKAADVLLFPHKATFFA